MEFGIMFVFHMFKVNRVMLQIAQRFALLVLLFANKTSALRSSTSRLPSRSGSAAHGQKHGEKLVRTEHDILEEHVLAVKGVCSVHVLFTCSRLASPKNKGTNRCYVRR